MLPIFGSIRKLGDFCCKRRLHGYERIAAIGLDNLDVSAFEPGIQFAEAVARHLTWTERLAPRTGSLRSSPVYPLRDIPAAMPETDHRTLRPRALISRSTPADFPAPHLS